VVPNSVRIPVPFSYVFPHGALFLGVDKLVNFDRLREADNQARDEHDVPLWVVKVMDLDPDAGKFGRSTEVKVKIAAPVQPVPPTASMPGYPPSVAFTDVTVTPYVDNGSCRGGNTPHRCRARLAWSVRAGELIDIAELDESPAAARAA